jgi:APA family basic amino acid/polyamine antiporter
LAFNHLVAGLITVAAALSYGELAGMMPKAGGQFVYIQRAYGRLVSFYMAGLFYRYSDWSYCCNCSYVCKLFCDILSVLDTTLFLDWAFVFLLVNCWLSQVLLLTFINTKGIESGKLIQLILTSAKLIALLHQLFWFVCWFFTDVLSNNFNNMWEASRTVLNGDGSITVTKLTGMAVWVLQERQS